MIDSVVHRVNRRVWVGLLLLHHLVTHDKDVQEPIVVEEREDQDNSQLEAVDGQAPSNPAQTRQVNNAKDEERYYEQHSGEHVSRGLVLIQEGRGDFNQPAAGGEHRFIPVPLVDHSVAGNNSHQMMETKDVELRL
jgi:hypothetical protein